MAIANCFECDKEIDVAMWDDAVGSGVHKPICVDCSEETPEYNLFDVSEHDPSDQRQPDKTPLPEGEDWIVINEHTEEHFREYEFGHREVEIEVPDKEKWEIWVHDADDEQAIEEAREEVRRRKNN